MQVEHIKNLNIKSKTAFKVGGDISDVYFPETIDEFLSIQPPYKVLGNISNTLISSAGYDGTVILTEKLCGVEINDNRIKAQAGVKGQMLSKVAAENNLSGFEFMIGFPGSLGGEIAMNASANGQCVSDKLINVKLYSKERGIFILNKNEMEFGYRTSICHKADYTVLEAEFELEKSERAEVEQRMADNLEFRRTHQPLLNLPNCGSVFKNPEGYSAGKLLDEVGAKNFSVGGAKVWENHANFIINPQKTASSKDILNLMIMMQSKVREKYDIDLKPEILYLGNRDREEEELCKILYQR